MIGAMDYDSIASQASSYLVINTCVAVAQVFPGINNFALFLWQKRCGFVLLKFKRLVLVVCW